MPKKADKEFPAFVDIYAELVSSNTDPVQYKPYNPHLVISNDEQQVFVHLKVPTAEVEVDKVVRKKRVIVITVDGMTMMLRAAAADIQAVHLGG